MQQKIYKMFFVLDIWIRICGRKFSLLLPEYS